MDCRACVCIRWVVAFGDYSFWNNILSLVLSLSGRSWCTEAESFICHHSILIGLCNFLSCGSYMGLHFVERAIHIKCPVLWLLLILAIVVWFFLLGWNVLLYIYGLIKNLCLLQTPAIIPTTSFYVDLAFRRVILPFPRNYTQSFIQLARNTMTELLGMVMLAYVIF